MWNHKVNPFPPVLRCFKFLYENRLMKTLSADLNKQNIYIKDLTTQYRKTLLVHSCALYFPLKKKRREKIHIFKWFWLISLLTFYCQWVKLNEINRWKIYFIPSLVRDNKTIRYSRNICKNVESCCPNIYIYIYM